MPDGKTQTLTDRSTRAFPGAVGAPRLLNAAAWLETLAALEAEFKTVLGQRARPTEQVMDRRGEP